MKPAIGLWVKSWSNLCCLWWLHLPYELLLSFKCCSFPFISLLFFHFVLIWRITISTTQQHFLQMERRRGKGGGGGCWHSMIQFLSKCIGFSWFMCTDGEEIRTMYIILLFYTTDAIALRKRLVMGILYLYCLNSRICCPSKEQACYCIFSRFLDS